MVQLTESLSPVILKILICSQEIVNQSVGVTASQTTLLGGSPCFFTFCRLVGWSVVLFHMAGMAGMACQAQDKGDYIRWLIEWTANRSIDVIYFRLKS